MHIVDTVIDEILARRKTSAQARVLAWAGGVLTERQADQTLAILGEPNDPDDPGVIRADGLARLRDPTSSRVPGQADLLATSARRALAAAVLQEAATVARDPDATLIERTVARLAAHRIRADLGASAELTKVQCLLIRGLEELGHSETAYQVTAAALAELPRDPQTAPQRADLLKAWLRLARTRPKPADDPLTQEAINLATTSGALFGTEARVWAAVNLLRRPGPRDAALSLAGQITTDLGTYPGGHPVVNQWRLLLASQAGQAPAIGRISVHGQPQGTKAASMMARVPQATRAVCGSAGNRGWRLARAAGRSAPENAWRNSMSPPVRPERREVTLADLMRRLSS